MPSGSLLTTSYKFRSVNSQEEKWITGYISLNRCQWARRLQIFCSGKSATTNVRWELTVHAPDNNNKQRDLLQGVNNIQITAQLHIPYTNTGQKCDEQLIPAAVLISLGINWQLDYEKQWNKSGWCSKTVKRQICRMCVFIKQKSITKKNAVFVGRLDWTGLYRLLFSNFREMKLSGSSVKNLSMLTESLTNFPATVLLHLSPHDFIQSRSGTFISQIIFVKTRADWLILFSLSSQEQHAQ